MLRKYFPSTDEGAALYGGFLQSENYFCKLFNLKESLSASIDEINTFLDINGYNTVDVKDFDENNCYESGPISISPHGYQEQYVLTIAKDAVSVSQFDFLINELKKFRDERDWSQFHNAKDLSIALSIESNELLENYLWKAPENADRNKVIEELADVFSFALLLAEKLEINIEEIILNKIKENALKYPIEKAKGTAKKYNDL